MTNHCDPADIFAAYPPQARRTLLQVRDMIRELAQELGPVDETVKWGEPSYRVKSGTSVRLGYKSETPEVVSVFFHCQTSLVATFREVYPEDFVYRGNRAVEIPLHQPWSEEILRHCLALAMTYQRVKHLPLLGATVSGQ